MELRRLSNRTARRKERYRRLAGLSREIAHGYGEQNNLLVERERLVRHTRDILRQAGDGLAWILLGRNPRIIAPLYEPQKHGVPEGVGLAGVLQVQQLLHDSGLYYALESDLVRCVGVGDLLVIPVGGIGLEPLPLELKSSGELVEGAQIGIGIITAYSGAESHARTYEGVVQVLGTAEWENPRVNPRAERQAAELERRTTGMFRLTRSGAQVLRTPAAPHWRVMEKVLNQACWREWSLDLAEEGVFKFAVRARPGDNVEGSLLKVFERIHELARVSPSNTHITATSTDLDAVDQLSALVLPVVLWPLPRTHRAAILAGELIAGGVRQDGLLERHLARRGITLTEVEGGVELRKEGQICSLPLLEFRRLRVDSALTGRSIADIAQSLSEAFNDDGPVSAVPPPGLME